MIYRMIFTPKIASMQMVRCFANLQTSAPMVLRGNFWRCLNASNVSKCPTTPSCMREMKTLSPSEHDHSPELFNIEKFLGTCRIPFQTGHTSLVASCPFCSKSKTLDKKSDFVTENFSLYINKTTGSHVCKSCGTAGTWNNFKSYLDGLSTGKSNKTSVKSNTSKPIVNVLPMVTTSMFWPETKALNKCDPAVVNDIINKFGIAILNETTLMKYDVHLGEYKFPTPNGWTVHDTCLVYPWYKFDQSEVNRVKIIRMSDNGDTSVAFDPKQGVHGLFGWNTIKPKHKQVVLTANEFDAMAVFQATGKPALAVPLGTSTLPLEVLAPLEQFEKIILWIGSDERARQATNMFAVKLKPYRCYFIRAEEDSLPMNALEALMNNLNVNKMIEKAHAFNHEKIITFDQIRNDIYNELTNPHRICGVQFKRFPKLSEYLKGHRRGELTVFTGPTGSGKTTFLSEMSLDLALQGVNTLWGSFEVRNTRLAKTMLFQLSGLDLRKEIHQFSYWADEFEALPMYFMNFYGSQSVKSVIETMSHAAYVYDIEHVIIDNLQFMMSSSGSQEDFFHLHSQAIGAFRKFASTKNVHITLVIHPRKENDDADLQTSSIFGSAKASQEADNVLILQDKKKAGKFLQVMKNRYDGTLGIFQLSFDPASLSMCSFNNKQIPKQNTEKKKLVKKQSLVSGTYELIACAPPKLASTSASDMNNGTDRYSDADMSTRQENFTLDQSELRRTNVTNHTTEQSVIESLNFESTSLNSESTSLNSESTSLNSEFTSLNSEGMVSKLNSSYFDQSETEQRTKVKNETPIVAPVQIIAPKTPFSQQPVKRGGKVIKYNTYNSFTRGGSQGKIMKGQTVKYGGVSPKGNSQFVPTQKANLSSSAVGSEPSVIHIEDESKSECNDNDKTFVKR